MNILSTISPPQPIFDRGVPTCSYACPYCVYTPGTMVWRCLYENGREIRDPWVCRVWQEGNWEQEND